MVTMCLIWTFAYYMILNEGERIVRNWNRKCGIIRDLLS